MNQQRRTIETEESEIIKARLGEVSRELESQRQLTERKTQEVHKMEKMINELDGKVKELTVQKMDIQGIKMEKEKQLQESVSTCECLQTALCEKEKELEKIWSENNKGIRMVLETKQQTEQDRSGMSLGSKAGVHSQLCHAPHITQTKPVKQTTAIPPGKHTATRSRTTSGSYASFQIGTGDIVPEDEPDYG